MDAANPRPAPTTDGTTVTMSSPGPSEVENVGHTVISMEGADSDVDFSSVIDLIRRRLNDIAGCKKLLKKTRNMLMKNEDLLHLNASSPDDFDRSKALIDVLLPIIKRSEDHARDACKVSAELLHALKDYANLMHTGLLSDLKLPDTQHVIAHMTSFAPRLSLVGTSLKEADAIFKRPEIEMKKLVTRGRRISSFVLTLMLAYLAFMLYMQQPMLLPILGAFLTYLSVVLYLIQLVKAKEQAANKAKREQTIRKAGMQVSGRVQMVAQHILKLNIPRLVETEFPKPEPFGIPPASDEWLKVATDLQVTIDVLEGV